MTAPATGSSRAGAGRGGARERWREALAAGGAALVLLAGCYTLPAREDLAPISFAPPVPLRADATRPERNAAVFDAVWSAVDANYYDPSFHGVDWPAARRRYRPAAAAAPDDDHLYGVINTMLGELDDGHTRALSPRSVAEQRERRWVWIGFECAPLKGSPELAVVTDVWPGGPALAAGVRRGWIVETCDGLGAQAFVSAYRRDRHLRVGQVVHCVMRDDANRVRPLDLTACATSIPAVRDCLELTSRVLYLRFDSFKEADARWLDAQLRAHRAMPAVVIDLRYNVGGVLEYLESIAGLFLPR